MGLGVEYDSIAGAVVAGDIMKNATTNVFRDCWSCERLITIWAVHDNVIYELTFCIRDSVDDNFKKLFVAYLEKTKKFCRNNLEYDVIVGFLKNPDIVEKVFIKKMKIEEIEE